MMLQGIDQLDRGKDAHFAAVVFDGLHTNRRCHMAFTSTGQASDRLARFPGSEVRICYPFYPRAGQVVQVVAQSYHGGAAHLTIVQSDGTLAKIPAWMTKEGSGEAVIFRDPVISVSALLEVRAMLDRSLRLSIGMQS